MSRSKVVPSNLFVEESTKIKQPSSYVNPLKHLQTQSIYIESTNVLDNKGHGLILKNVETEIVNCKLIGNVGHAINLSDEHTFQYLKLKLTDPRR